MLTDHRWLAAPTAAALALAVTVLDEGRALAQPMPPAGHDDEAFNLMNELAHRGLHNLQDESWNLYGQFTYITSYHPAIPAAYTNVNGSVNSLWTQPERGFTSTFTLFGGVRLWHGGEVYVVPEIIAERAFSMLRGLGGSTENFELQKTGSEAPTVYRSRLYYRQTFESRRRACREALGPHATRRGHDESAFGAHGRKLLGHRRLRPQQRRGQSPPKLLQRGVHDPRLVRLPRGFSRVHVGG